MRAQLHALYHIMSHHRIPNLKAGNSDLVNGPSSWRLDKKIVYRIGAVNHRYPVHNYPVHIIG